MYLVRSFEVLQICHAHIKYRSTFSDSAHTPRAVQVPLGPLNAFVVALLNAGDADAVSSTPSLIFFVNHNPSADDHPVRAGFGRQCANDAIVGEYIHHRPRMRPLAEARLVVSDANDGPTLSA